MDFSLRKTRRKMERWVSGKSRMIISKVRKNSEGLGLDIGNEEEKR